MKGISSQKRWTRASIFLDDPMKSRIAHCFATIFCFVLFRLFRWEFKLQICSHFLILRFFPIFPTFEFARGYQKSHRRLVIRECTQLLLHGMGNATKVPLFWNCKTSREKTSHRFHLPTNKFKRLVMFFLQQTKQHAAFLNDVFFLGGRFNSNLLCDMYPDSPFGWTIFFCHLAFLATRWAPNSYT